MHHQALAGGKHIVAALQLAVAGCGLEHSLPAAASERGRGRRLRVLSEAGWRLPAAVHPVECHAVAVVVVVVVVARSRLQPG